MSLATAEKSKLLNGSLTHVTDRLEDGVRSARRAVKHGRDAVEDIIEDKQHAVKRNPLGAVGIAFAAGILAGGAATWLVNWGKEASFAWNAGANIPSRFVNAVAEGIQDVISAGVLAGCELTDVLVSVEDGSYHEQDSTEAVFREASQKATIAAIRQARPTIMEAVSICRTVVPAEYAIAIEEIFSGKAQIESVQSEKQSSSVIATVPTSGVGKLLEQVLAATNGSAEFSLESNGFRPKAEPPETTDVWAPVKSR